MGMTKPMKHIPEANEILAYFQPIVSLQTRKIYGYEVLGRRRVGKEVVSLGPFFKNSNISDKEHLRVDRMLRGQAFERLMKAAVSGSLFINLKPSWIYRVYRETGELPTLRLLKQFGIPGSRLVIEVTEEEFDGHLSELSDILAIYRQIGCRIAIDDIGSGFSSLDRIAVIRPDILKMDLSLLKKSARDEGYRALMRSFAILSAQMGASLLVEGVETREELHHALHAGARFVQGFWFSPALPEFVAEDRYSGAVSGAMEWFRERERVRYDALAEVERTLEERIAKVASSIALERGEGEGLAGDVPCKLPEVTSRAGLADEADELLARIAPSLPLIAIRMYMCREDGSQLSSNFVRGAGSGWGRDETYRGANWLWRPYFLPNILTMKDRQIGLLSQPYSDLESARSIRTYSCPFGSDSYLFIDLKLEEA